MSAKPKFVIHMLPVDLVVESMKAERAGRRGGRCGTCGGVTKENHSACVTRVVDGELVTRYFHCQATGHDCFDRAPKEWKR